MPSQGSTAGAQAASWGGQSAPVPLQIPDAEGVKAKLKESTHPPRKSRSKHSTSRSRNTHCYGEAHQSKPRLLTSAWDIISHVLENCLPSHSSYCTATLSNLQHGTNQPLTPHLHYPTKQTTGSTTGCQKLKGTQQATLPQSSTDSTATSASLGAVLFAQSSCRLA